jgi:hypothetical protein
MSALGTRLLKVKVNSTDYTATCKTVKVSAADANSDFVTFNDAATGGSKVHTLNFTAAQDMAPGSLWRLQFLSAGSTIQVLVNPYGVTTATDTTPFYSGSVVIPKFDGDYLGGDADTSTTAKLTFDGAWDFTADPVLVTSGAF